jgi:hypothetical protein
VTTPTVDKRAQVQTLLTDILRLMEYPARLDFKEMPDGGIGVAMHFEGELPNISAGRRGPLVDGLQFLVNKCVNRPNTERCWVSLGVNEFPEVRTDKPPEGQKKAEPPAPPASAPQQKAPPPKGQPAAVKGAQASAPKTPVTGKPAQAPARPAAAAQEPRRPEARREPDERSLPVAEDPAWTALGRALAEKSARHGRYYGLMLLSPDNRARLLAAGQGVAGTSLKVEGEGCWRRLTYVPEKPVLMPKKQVMPDYDEEE